MATNAMLRGSHVEDPGSPVRLSEGTGEEGADQEHHSSSLCHRVLPESDGMLPTCKVTLSWHVSTAVCRPGLVHGSVQSG